MKFKKTIVILSLIIISFIGITNITNAETTDINLTIRSGNTIIFSNTIPLPPAGIIDLNSHPLNADSVLSILNNADISSPDFSISDLQYYDSFGSFYLKCITSLVGNNCENWQYTVNDTYPGKSMDKKILSGGESIYLYFGTQNKTLLSSNNINTNDALTVTTQEYDYKNNGWKERSGVTVGLTQPDPSNPWSPIEVKTNSVNTTGQAIFLEIPIGSYNVGVKEDFYFPTELLTVTEAPAPIIRNNGGGVLAQFNLSPVVEKTKFNINKAFEFLLSEQKENGSFGEDLYTDWATLALATMNFEKQNKNLQKYLQTISTKNYQLTDYERHSMALMSMGLNPYNVSGGDYIREITSNFDGKQFGDIKEDNDDIFALIVLQNAGYTKEEDIIKNTITYIISKQKENGSWDESIDMTGAAIGSLSYFNQDEKVKNSLTKAREFLKQNQKDTGGWANVSSTSWAIQGILALSERPEDWVKNNNTPIDYLVQNQDSNGGIKNLSAPSLRGQEAGEYLENRIWETAYSLTALSGKTWNQIMQKFEKPNNIKKGDEINKKTNTQTVTKKNLQETKNKKIQNKENKKQTSESVAKENKAIAIESTNDTTVKKIEAKSNNWFKRFFTKIFSF